MREKMEMSCGKDMEPDEAKRGTGEKKGWILLVAELFF